MARPWVSWRSGTQTGAWASGCWRGRGPPPFLSSAGRAVCAGLMIWMAVQFKDFYRDYLTDYRNRSAFWFNGNHPGAFGPIVQDHRPGDARLIYLSESLPWIRQHWKLYLIRTGRIDLLQRTAYFSLAHLDRR